MNKYDCWLPRLITSICLDVSDWFDKMNWQRTANQCTVETNIVIPQQRMFLKRLPPSLDTMISQLIERIRTLLSAPNLNRNRRIILAS